METEAQSGVSEAGKDLLFKVPPEIESLALELFKIGVVAMKGSYKTGSWSNMDSKQKRGWYAIAEHLKRKDNRECGCHIFETCINCK